MYTSGMHMKAGGGGIIGGTPSSSTSAVSNKFTRVGLIAAAILLIVIMAQMMSMPSGVVNEEEDELDRRTRDSRSGLLRDEEREWDGIFTDEMIEAPRVAPINTRRAGVHTATMSASTTLLSGILPSVIIIMSSGAGLVFAAILWLLVDQVKVSRKSSTAASSTLLPVVGATSAISTLPSSHVNGHVNGGGDGGSERLAAEIQEAISLGADSFLRTEYRYVGYFMMCFSCVIFVFLGAQNGFSAASMSAAFYSTVAFLSGGVTSAVCGYLGMKIATYANARTALEARKGVCEAFVVAFRAGAVMGFFLTSLGLLVLWITVAVFKLSFGDDWETLYECIAAYGLGGSSIALFGRVGGGIYTKAADVGADLVGKVEAGIPEDDPRNPATIADNVGDNVGDIAGMGADLFGSFAEATCAALVIASVSSLGTDHVSAALAFPLLITALGIIVCILTSLLCTEIFPPRSVAEIEPALKRNLIVSTVLMTPAVIILAHVALPTAFTGIFADDPTRVVYSWQVAVTVIAGLWAGLLIGVVTEYYTSNTYSPVCEVAQSCRTGAATNIIFGLALGYKSCIVPVFAIAVSAYLSFSLAGFFGCACAALGMLGTLATGLAIDAYGPISDNAGGIAEMAGMGEEIRERTDALDAAGNTTAAIGKGFAIGSAALVSLALFGAYVTRAGVKAADASILDAKVFFGLIIGAMLPYWFSAQTMKSVGKAALAMVVEVRRQFATIPGLMEGTVRPDYARCVAISTDASLVEMIPPGCLVMITPIVFGVCFGTKTLAGLLAGGLVSGVQMAISASNTGGAWDNAKKYIEAGRTLEARELGGKGSDAHKAAVVGDTVGDPLKDTSGPALNILMKLMAVESLVLAPFFAKVTANGIIFTAIEKMFKH